MRPSIIIGIIAVCIIAVVITAGAMGFINLGSLFGNLTGDNSDPGDPGNRGINGTFTNLHLSTYDIHSIISLLTNTSPPYPEHKIFIEGLHMTVWGADGITAYSVLRDYENLYRSDGYTSYTTGVKRGVGWTAYAEIWYNDLGMGRAITVGDGSSVRGLYGYDVALTTSYGPVLDYYDYVSFLSRY